MVTYVATGGMVATTWVQIIKACLLLGGASFMAFAVLSTSASRSRPCSAPRPKSIRAAASILGPGKLVTDPISAISLGLALMFGTAGLPHILMRFFTVPDAKAARKSVFYATGFIGYFYILTFIIGFGAITLLMNDPAYFKPGDGGVFDKIGGLIGGTNMAAVHLSKAVGGSLFLGFISAVAFATILAVVGGPDAGRRLRHQPRSLCQRLREGPARPRSTPKCGISKIAAVVIGIVAILLGYVFENQNVAFMVGPRVRRRRELQFPGAADEHLLARDDHARRRFVGGFLGLVSAVGMVRPEPGRVGEDVRLPSADLPLRQPGAVLDDARLPRHLDRLAARPQRAGRGRTGRLRSAVRALRNRHRRGGREPALGCSSTTPQAGVRTSVSAASRRHSGKDQEASPSSWFRSCLRREAPAGRRRARPSARPCPCRVPMNTSSWRLSPQRRCQVLSMRVSRSSSSGPTALRHGRPPVADGLVTNERAGLRQLADPLRPRRQPEEALGAHDTRPAALKNACSFAGSNGRRRDRRSSRCRTPRSRACAREIRGAP